MSVDYAALLSFAHEHSTEDPLKLLLRQSHYPDIDLRMVVQQLEGQRQASAKWPTLASIDGYFFPPRLNREQSSCEAAARYNARLFAQLGGGTFADLTGGMGVDCYFLAQEARDADYCECDASLADIARHNFAALHQYNIRCHIGDSLARLRDNPSLCYDALFIDPARRDSQGRKMVAFEDCTPNLLDNLPLLLARCRHLLVKASPMIDIQQALNQLQQVSQVHVFASAGECKEVLFVLSSNACGEPTLHCVNQSRSDISQISFTPSDEEVAASRVAYAPTMGQYLYEPHAAIMKGGCFNYLGALYGVAKLARNTHLYTSNQHIDCFPGRCFEVLQELPLNVKETRKTLPDGAAHVIARNYPMAADALQRKLKLREGGTLFVVAASLGQRPMGWLCRLL